MEMLKAKVYEDGSSGIPMNDFNKVTKALLVMMQDEIVRKNSAFLEVRTYGKYKNKGFYLGEPSFDSIKWTIVTDEGGAQILVPVQNVQQ
jgi:hypothetical protein